MVSVFWIVVWLQQLRFEVFAGSYGRSNWCFCICRIMWTAIVVLLSSILSRTWWSCLIGTSSIILWSNVLPSMVQLYLLLFACLYSWYLISNACVFMTLHLCLLSQNAELHASCLKGSHSFNLPPTGYYSQGQSNAWNITSAKYIIHCCCLTPYLEPEDVLWIWISERWNMLGSWLTHGAYQAEKFLLMAYHWIILIFNTLHYLF